MIVAPSPLRRRLGHLGDVCTFAARLASAWGVALLLAAAPPEARALTFVVVNNGDAGARGSTADGVCDTLPGPSVGACTLRAAIEEAMGTAGAPHTIAFALPGGSETINLGSTLPVVNLPVFIDGWTQGGGGYTGPPLVQVDGNGNSAFSLQAGSSNSTIRGLAIANTGGTGWILGITIQGSSNNQIVGNYLGLDLAGNPAGYNVGVYIGNSTTATDGNTVGGTTAAARNVISGNVTDGIEVTGGTGGCTGTTITGNYIGTDVTGTLDMGNTNQGIAIFGTSNTSTVVGGTDPGAGNVISGNDGFGILIADTGTTGTVVQGNKIGTDYLGTSPIPNSVGIRFDAGSVSNSMIGGTTADAGNTIAHNADDGVRLTTTAGTGNSILGNAIHSNGGLGIDLRDDGVTLNDWGVLDVDPGPNNLQNFPHLGPPVETAGTLSVNYGLDTSAGWFRVEFFRSALADGSGYGEGEIFAAAVMIDHPGGRANYSTTFAGNAGDVITATATACDDGVCTNPTDTSEFSVAVTAVTTAVELMSFTAAGGDRSVLLEWETASELDNLGFHLHRSSSENGPWTRITSSLIPGLGSSPMGASYSWPDTDVSNDVRYFYRLEDIDTASLSTFHGPVSAVPEPAAAPPPDDENGSGGEPAHPPGPGSPEPLPEKPPEGPGGEPCPTCPRIHGDPDGASFRVVSRSASGLVVELRTPGFVATPDATGVRITVPGFDEPSDPLAPALPLKRALLNGVIGRSARVVSVQATGVLSFPDLTPAAVGEPVVDVAPDGIVHALRAPVALDTSSGAVLPDSFVRVVSSAFLGETKKLALEMNPLRYDTATGELLLARTLTAEIAFDSAPSALETGSGSRGRRRPPSLRRGSADVLAHLHARETGLHAVSFDSLFPARQRPIPLSSLKLSLSGDPVPFHVEPSSRLFRSGSTLYFLVARSASSTDYSAETAYVLERARGGVRMARLSAAPAGAPVSLAPLAFERFETNRVYQAGLLSAPDIWLWQSVPDGYSREVSFSLEGLDSLSSLPARVRVFLQGGSDSGTTGEHHVSVALNGSFLEETSFEGRLPHVLEKPVSASRLVEGPNTLTLTNLADAGVSSLVFLDRIEVTSPQLPALRDGLFEAELTEGGVATVGGAASLAVDVTDPLEPVWLVGLESVGGSVRLQAEADHRYVVASSEGLLIPRVSPPVRSGLRNPANRADYVLIAPEAFLEAAQPLLQRRQDQGLETCAASLEEIASVFGHARPSAQAIRDFLAYAFHSWQAPSLRYVVLLGDASYDPRNFTGRDRGSPLPALWTKTSYMWTVSDPTLAAVNGEDSLPDIALGRLPATTVEEAEALVQKVLDWEGSGQGLGGLAVLVADDPDEAGDFEADVTDIATSFLGGRPIQTLRIRELQGSTCTEILSAFDQGASLMSYVGHGGPAVWASENVLNSWHPPALLAQSQQPLMLTMNCLNGYFVAPNYDALSEAFLKVEGRGTIGAFSPSGLSLDGPAHQFHRAIVSEITADRHDRLGDAVLAAQARYAETGLMPELLEIYHLLGDPGMRIR